MDYRNVSRIYGSDFSELTSIESIESGIAQSGPGARGIVFGIRENGQAHFFNVVNQWGVVRFLDGQTGTAVDLSKFKAFRLLRTN